MASEGFSPVWQAGRVPRAGNTEAEYEDALAAAAGRFAIADGASESSFAGLWAQLLSEGFVNRTQGFRTNGSWLATLRERWSAAVDPLELPWYAEQKREQGAFATFLGLVIRSGRGGGRGWWRAVAVGDGCLFHL